MPPGVSAINDLQAAEHPQARPTGQSCITVRQAPPAASACQHVPGQSSLPSPRARLIPIPPSSCILSLSTPLFRGYYRLQASWQRPPGNTALFFRLYIRKQGESEWQRVAQDKDLLTFTVADLQPMTTYEFRVQTYSNHAEGPYTDTFSAATAAGGACTCLCRPCLDVYNASSALNQVGPCPLFPLFSSLSTSSLLLWS